MKVQLTKKQNNDRWTKLFVQNSIFYSVIIFGFTYIYTNHAYYLSTLSISTRRFLVDWWAWFWLAVTIGQFIGVVVSKYRSEKKLKNINTDEPYTTGFSQLILNYLHNLILVVFRSKKADKKKLKFEPQTRTAFLAYIVKFFFFPIMLNTVIINGNNIYLMIYNALQHGLNWDLNTGLSSALSIIFFVDTIYFAFGYAIETRFLKSKIKSVEPTLFGWLVTLICYPPFNGATGKFLPLPKGVLGTGLTALFPFLADIAIFNDNSTKIVIALRILMIALYVVYVWATVALGAKGSNLTNRGIISKGPYKFIRHPAFISKNLAWWVEGLLSATSWWYFVALAGWNIIYFLRAVTEERHLSQDPDYREYKKKVKWMFIPGLI